jgi:hypothetical protein
MILALVPGSVRSYKYSMLSLQERAKITEALELWAKYAPDKPMLGFVDEHELLRPREILEHVAKNTSAGESILQFLEHGVRRKGIEAVLARLSQRAQAY